MADEVIKPDNSAEMAAFKAEVERLRKSNSEILRFINNEIHNKDYRMVKGSNSTGLKKIIKKLN